MMSRQVSLNPKSGPLNAHSTMIASAEQKPAGWPAARDVVLANRVNREFVDVIWRRGG